MKKTLPNARQFAEDWYVEARGKSRAVFSRKPSGFSPREGADIYQIAKNCRTSVEMIEKFHAALSRTRWTPLQSMSCVRATATSERMCRRGTRPFGGAASEGRSREATGLKTPTSKLRRRNRLHAPSTPRHEEGLIGRRNRHDALDTAMRRVIRAECFRDLHGRCIFEPALGRRSAVIGQSSISRSHA